MGEMRYLTVTSDVSGFLVSEDDPYTPAGIFEPLTTYALVPVPPGERMVVVVTEDGAWPTEVIRAMAWGFIMGPGETASENARDMLDAVVSLAEGSE